MIRISFAVVVAALAATACGTSGRELRPPDEPAGGESVPAITQLPTALALNSPGLTGPIDPGGFSDSYPVALTWTTPAAPVEWALTATAEDGEILWLVVGIPADARAYGSAEMPGVVIPNARGVEWSPPEGDLRIRLFALDRPLRTDGTLSPDALVARLETVRVDEAVLDIEVSSGS